MSARKLIACAGQPGFRLECAVPRIVASDYLVSVDINRYSVPFGLIGETVDVKRQGEHLHIPYQGKLVATHARLTGKHQLCLLPEHEPGAIARNTRLRYSSAGASAPRGVDNAEVEVRECLRAVARIKESLLSEGDRARIVWACVRVGRSPPDDAGSRAVARYPGRIILRCRLDSNSEMRPAQPHESDARSPTEIPQSQGQECLGRTAGARRNR